MANVFQRLSVSPESSRTRKCDSFLTPQSEVRCARGGGLPPSPVAPPLGRLPPFFAQKSVSSWGSVDAANSQATVDPPSCSVVVMSAPGSPPNCFGDGPPRQRNCWSELASVARPTLFRDLRKQHRPFRPVLVTFLASWRRYRTPTRAAEWFDERLWTQRWRSTRTF